MKLSTTKILLFPVHKEAAKKNTISTHGTKTIETLAATEPLQTKRRPGRPPKQPNLSSSQNNRLGEAATQPPIANVQIPQTKRGPGRPSKQTSPSSYQTNSLVKLVTQSSTSNVQVPQAKRGPGRPPKQSTHEQQTSVLSSPKTHKTLSSSTDSLPPELDTLPSRSRLAKVALDKMTMHLWYLSEKNVAFAFFDERIPENERDLMAARMMIEPKAKFATINGRLNIEVSDYSSLSKLKLSDFVCKQTVKFFTALGLDIAFTNKPSSQWATDESYKFAKAYVNKILVVNDVAERAVRLVQDYNKKSWKHEDEFQDMLRTVGRARKG